MFEMMIFAVLVCKKKKCVLSIIYPYFLKWKISCPIFGTFSPRNRNDLAEMLALLKTQIDPALLVKKEGEEGSTTPNQEDQESKKGENNGRLTELDVLTRANRSHF